MNGLLHAHLQAPWLSGLGWILVHTLWEGALVSLAATLLLRGMRGASPRARYAVAVAALLIFAGLPLRRAATHLVHPPAARMALHGEGGRPLAAASAFPSAASGPALRTRMAERLEEVLPWMVLAWGAGMMAFLARLAGGWAWLQHLRWQRSELAPDTLQRRLLDLCRRTGMKRAVTLLACEGLAGPSVVGVLRPAILVPAGWFLNLEPAHLEALLAHELAHVLRHDYLVNLLQSVLEVVFFYHPALWWLSRRIRREREMACDAFAVHQVGSPLPLAEALAVLETRGLGRMNLEPSLAAHGGSLMERIQNLLLPAPRSSSAPAFGAVAILTLLLATGLHLGARNPDAAPGMPTHMELPKGVTVNWDSTHLYLDIHHAKDAEGKKIPYTFLVDLVAQEVPLNQAWKAFQEAFQAVAGKDREIQIFGSRAEKVEGPRVSLDLKGATPAEVEAALNRLAKEHGVAPYQAPPDHALGVFKIGKHVAADGSTRYDLHARQVSCSYLLELLATARKLETDSAIRNGAIANMRDRDKGTGPKVDAIFEDLPLPELEKRVVALISGAR